MEKHRRVCYCSTLSDLKVLCLEWNEARKTWPVCALITQAGTSLPPESTEPTLGDKSKRPELLKLLNEINSVLWSLELCYWRLAFRFVRVQLSKEIFMKSIPSSSSKSTNHKLWVWMIFQLWAEDGSSRIAQHWTSINHNCSDLMECDFEQLLEMVSLWTLSGNQTLSSRIQGEIRSDKYAKSNLWAFFWELASTASFLSIPFE